MKLVKLIILTMMVLNISCIGKEKTNIKINNKPIPKYPFTHSTPENYYKFPTDKNGIVQKEFDGKLTYYPIRYSMAALYEYAAFLERDNKKERDIHYNKFINYAKFIYDNQVEIKNFTVWRCNEPVKPYKLSVPWSSSMAQSLCMGVMLEAYSLTNDEKYLDTAKKAVEAFNYDIKDGGVLSNWNGTPFYEEYADPNSHVLNGNIFSLAGLYYFYKTYHYKKAKLLFDQGVKSLKIKIKEYDAGFTLYYNKQNEFRYSSVIGYDPDHYHEIVILFLTQLYYWTEEPLFKEYAHLFLKQDLGQVGTLYRKNKFKKITASYTIDAKEYGVEHLNDELYSFGKYWSCFKKETDLDLLFWNEKKNISDIVFYANDYNALPNNYEIYVKKAGKYIYVCSNSDIEKRMLKTHKTGNFRTYIEKIALPKKINGEGLRIKFKPKGNKIIKLREINVFFDRWDVFDDILLNKASKNLPN